MKAKVKLLVVISLMAVLVSCFGSPTVPAEKAIVGSWRLYEIWSTEGTFIPTSNSIRVYNLNRTYEVYYNGLLIDEGQYVLRQEDDLLMLYLSPSNSSYNIGIIGDTMSMTTPHIYGGSVKKYSRIRD